MRISSYQRQYDASVKTLANLLYNISSLAWLYDQEPGQSFNQAVWDELKANMSDRIIKGIQKSLEDHNKFYFPESPLSLDLDLFLIESGESTPKAKINHPLLKQKFMDLAKYEIESLEFVG